jgi:hypothetical protein
MIALIGAMLIAASTGAAAQSEQCLTKPDQLAPAITAKDALQWAQAEAAKTDADSTLTSMMTTGAVDAEGRSTGWMLQLLSAGKKRWHLVRFNAGAMTCTTNPHEGPIVVTPITESAVMIVDLKQLVGTARDASKPPPDLAVLRVVASLQRNEGDAAARWSISFVDERGYPKGEVTIDAMTGAVIGK